MSARRVALCMASRGNPELLSETLRIILPTCTLATKKAVVGLDDDDPTLMETRAALDRLCGKRIVVSIGPRQDAIGAVYNRCASSVDADLYINGADDMRILTRGWDALLSEEAGSFLDDIGMIGFGQLPFPSILPALAATTRGLIEKMGYFLQDYTPYWWMDTWLYEIVSMIGRNHYVPIDVEAVGPLRTRGLREFHYWVCFFDDMRVHRRKIAESILSSPDFLVSAARRQELCDNLDHVCAEFRRLHVGPRDSAMGERLEKEGSYDAPDDERYRRIKARSMKLLQELGQNPARVV
jgi:hypothetical protein